jgi:hypothetical protein
MQPAWDTTPASCILFGDIKRFDSQLVGFNKIEVSYQDQAGAQLEILLQRRVDEDHQRAQFDLAYGAGLVDQRWEPMQWLPWHDHIHQQKCG